MKHLLILLLLTSSLFASDMIYAGYVPAYRMSYIDQFDYENLTHVFAAFGNPDSTGDLTTPHNIDQFVSKVTANGTTKAYLSIGGGGSYSWGEDTTVYHHLFADSNRTMFITKIVDYLEEYEFSGVDCDVEGTPLGHPNYNVFVQELADSVHAHNLDITAALGVSTWGGASHLEDETLQAFDLIMTMSYGGSWASEDLSNFAKYENDLDYFLGRGVNPANLAGGIPFYAVIKGDKEITIDGLYSDDHLASQDPFYNDTLYTEDNTPVFHNSWPTIKRKIDHADSIGTGIMIWELGQDNFGDTLCMTDTIAEYLTPGSSVDIREMARPNIGIHNFNENDVTSVRVMDIRGRQIKTLSESSSVDINDMMSELQPGIYFIRKIDINGIIDQSHFVIH